jgi:hypothetical protein
MGFTPSNGNAQKDENLLSSSSSVYVVALQLTPFLFPVPTTAEPLSKFNEMKRLNTKLTTDVELCKPKSCFKKHLKKGNQHGFFLSRNLLNGFRNFELETYLRFRLTGDFAHSKTSSQK